MQLEFIGSQSIDARVGRADLGLVKKRFSTQNKTAKTLVFRPLFCKIDLSTVRSKNLTDFCIQLQNGLDQCLRDSGQIIV